MKVDRKWEEFRIEELEEVIFNLACILKVSRHTLHLCSVGNGCVQLTLLVPNNIPDVFGFVLGCAKSAHVFQKLSYPLCGLCL